MNNKIETIECAPSWEGILPLLLEGYTKANPHSEARQFMHRELQRMARIADAHIAQKESRVASLEAQKKRIMS